MTSSSTAAASGFRMPAEWEPLERVWVSPPHNEETWPCCLKQAQQQFDTFLHALRNFVTVSTCEQLGIATNDSWIRDYGPIFVTDGKGGIACHDFQFNSWGGKYEVRDLDNAVPPQIARHLELPCWSHDTVLEGGAIEVNGKGTVIVAEPTLLTDTRNPEADRAALERVLAKTLGAPNVIWLPEGIRGDDTDGHVDNLARFVNPTTLLVARTVPGNINYEPLERNWQVLEAARDQDGQKFNLLPLYIPEPITYHFPADRFGPGGLMTLPASYANFLIANGAVFVPIFRRPSDDAALKAIEDALPHHRVFGIPCDYVAVGLGALHCLTMQQPKA